MNKNSWNDSLPSTDTLKTETQKTTTTPSTSTTSATTTPSTSYGAVGYESSSAHTPAPTPLKSSSTGSDFKPDHGKAESKRDTSKAQLTDVVADAKDKLDDVVTTGRHALDNVSAEMKKQPYVAMGVAAGVAFGIGTILGSRLLRWAAVLGAGYAVSQLLRGDSGKRVAEMVKTRVRSLES